MNTIFRVCRTVRRATGDYGTMTNNSNSSDNSNSNYSMNETIDLAAVQAKLAKDGGKRFWQSLEELAETPGYRYKLENEFPENSEKEAEGIDRRGILKLMAASAAMAGLSACTKLPTEKIVPYVRPPEEIIPGKPPFDDAIRSCDRTAG